MGSKVLDIQHTKIARFEYLHRFPECRWICPREDPFPNPHAERLRVISSDEMKQATAGIADYPVNHSPHVVVVLRSYVLDHSERHEGVEAAPNIAIVFLNKFDLGGEAFFFSSFPGEHNLFVGDIECSYPHTVVFGHVQGESPPPAAGLGHYLARLQPKFLANQIELRALCFFQRCRAIRKIRARVNHFGIEPKLVEICREIVMVVDVFV